MRRALIVDDDESFAFGLRQILEGAGFTCERAANGEEALAAVRRASWDVVTLDLGLPDRSGLEVLAHLVEIDPFCAVVVLTGRDEASPAIRALRLGATHYLLKPVSRDELLFAVDQACERFGLRRRLEAANRAAGDAPCTVGESPIWKKTLHALYAAARAPRTPVLLTGESGTGKEVAAQQLHLWSDRVDGPFISVNAACFTPSLLESELFGHEAGAFTGARTTKRGLFELASGGTLFLDEVGELPIELQPKLLRVLEGHPFRRVGGERELRADVRLISATNQNLPQAIDAGRFRLDLFHRLRVMDVALPALRDRGDDLELLTAHFVARFSAELCKPGAALSSEALTALRGYTWPGNVRELKNVIERGLVVCQGGLIYPTDLPPEMSARTPLRPSSIAPGSSSTRPLETVIREHVLRTFRACRGNVTQTAKALGVSRVALRRRLKEYGSEPTHPGPRDGPG